MGRETRAVNESSALIRLEKLKNELARVTDLDQARDIRDKAEAIRIYTKAAGDSLEMQNRCAEIKLRAERRLGELLQSIDGFGRGKKSVTVTDFDIDHNQSKRWQRIASIPDKQFDHFVTSLQASGKEITTAAALRIARQIENEHRNNGMKKRSKVCRIDDLNKAAKQGHRFHTIYADPPWKYGNQSTRAATDNHYPTMTVEEISALPVESLCHDEAVLLLWTTNGFLVEALTQVIPAWGFEFKSSMIWCKPQMGIGNYVRLSHEFLLIASRGGMRTNGKNQISWIEHPRERHSAKPDRFRTIVEQMTINPRLELFAREARPGWSAWGNQIDRQQFLEMARQ